MRKGQVWVLGICCIAGSMTAQDNAQYCLFYKKQYPTTKINVYSERCSGSYFLSGLLKNNLPELEHTWEYGYKHYPVWIEHSYRAEYTFENAEDTLFVLIVRNPYDWALSFYTTPWGLDSSRVQSSSLLFFLKSPCVPKKNARHYSKQMDPDTNKPFENPLVLRTKKTQNFLAILEKVPNCYCVQYEVLVKNRQAVIAEIARLFTLKKQDRFYDITMHLRGGMEVKTPRKKEALTKEAKAFINQHLDWGVEERIGYQREEL